MKEPTSTVEMKTLIIGMGNPILADDGVGIRVAKEVKEAIKLISIQEISVIEASVGGLRLAELMVDQDRAIIIDAMTSKAAVQPGTIRRLSIEDLAAMSPHHTASTHDTTLSVALEMGKHMGLRLPKEIVIFAIETEEIREFSETLTPAVERAVPLAVDAVLQEIFA